MNNPQIFSAKFIFSLCAALLLLSACKPRGNWPDGMEAIHWDRDACAGCGMVISDPRFAVELRGGAKNTVFKFDDMGCLAAWLREKAGANLLAQTPNPRIWVADFASFRGSRETLRWLDARTARYIRRSSPMGYDFAAVENAAADEKTIGFDEILQSIQATQQRGRQ